MKTVKTGGGYFNDIAFSPANNRIYIGGSFRNPGNNFADFDPSPLDQVNLDDANGYAFLASYTLDGTVFDAVNFGSRSSITSLTTDPTGNIYTTGSLSSPAGSLVNLNPSGDGTSFEPANGQMFIAKYSDNMSFITADQIDGGSAGPKYDEGLCIIAPANDQIFYGGRVNGGLYLAKRNSNFGLEYEKYYGGSGAVTALTTQGNYLYFSASSLSSASINLGNNVSLNPVNSSGDILLAKTNLSGLANWGPLYQ